MTARIVVVGLGPAGPELLTAETAAAIDRVPHRYLRTARHPSAAIVADAVTFDGALRDGVVGRRGLRRHRGGARPGGRGARRGAVRGARDPRSWPSARWSCSGPTAGAAVRILPALSYLDLAWTALGVDPLAAGVRLVDARRFAVEAAGERGPLLVAQCDSVAVLSDVKLAVDDGAEPGPVTVLQRLGLPDQAVFEVAWDDLDRAIEPDHLTTLWIPSLAAPVGRELVRFHELVRTLRERCPWDREQTHRSLTSHVIEETYEVVEAIESGRRRPPRRGARRPPVPGRVPRRHRRAGGAIHDGRRGPRHPRQARAPPPARVRHGRRRRRRAGARQLGGDQAGREGAHVAVRRHPGRTAGARLRRQGAAQGGLGGVRLGRRRRRPAQGRRGGRRAGRRRRPPTAGSRQRSSATSCSPS